MNGIKICLAGADGRMGRQVAQEAARRGDDVVGAISAVSSPNIGRTLRSSGIAPFDALIEPPSELARLLSGCDVLISFATPEADVDNIPVAAATRKPIVSGTTGFTEGQMEAVCEAVAGKSCAVISPNFSIGMNYIFSLMNTLDKLPVGYDVSIVEAHHTGKKDSPSGTAKTIAEIVKKARGCSNVVTERKDARKPDELEVFSVRAGGIPGIHEIIIAGENESIRIEHTAFSRAVFAQGALFAARWAVVEQSRGRTGIFSMKDVLNSGRH